jgi:hypothetical protein
MYHLCSPRAIDQRPRTPPPPLFPSGRPHVATELVLLARTPFSTPSRVCRVAELPKRPSFAAPVAGKPEAAGPPPAPPLAERPLFGRDGPPAQSGWASQSRPAEFGPFAQYHLPFFHSTKH